MTTIRAYERSDLPLKEKLVSLARRFPCLHNAAGIDPWSVKKLRDWTLNRIHGSAEYHAGLFVLNLADCDDCDKFDILEAARIWEEPDRQVFVNWMRVWRF